MSRYIQARQARRQWTVAEVGFDSREGLLKCLSALVELTYKLAKKLWALWLGLGSVALAGHSGQVQSACVALAAKQFTAHFRLLILFCWPP